MVNPEPTLAETTENPQAETPQVAEAPQQEAEENQEKINWRRFREKRAVERKEKEAAERDVAKKAEEIAALKAAVEALANKPPAVAMVHEDEDEDKRITRRVEEKIAEVERRRDEERSAREQREIPMRLVQAFPDFASVCTEENLDYLEYHYPEVADTFKRLPESYEKWQNLYRAVKRFVNNPNSKKDEKRAEKNLMKPQSISVGGMTKTGDSPPTSVGEARKKENWSRMQKTMRGG